MQILAAQLDLARQKEPIVYIRSFAKFIKQQGFNTLFLYLEGRIRTESFPYMKSHESYTTDEIEELLSYCRKIKLEVIPCIATLGHAEQFLESPEMQHLSELKDGIEDRWFRVESHNQFCPSCEGTYDFLEKYLAEIADLFPSQYFHADLDESWNLGICPVCQKRMDEVTGATPIFVEHIKRIHSMLKSLGKRMMMWDDMFDIYPLALQKISRDIVLLPWCYSMVTQPGGQFLHRERKDPFAQYDKLGFDYVMATGFKPDNIIRMTRYAKKYKPIGMLATIWERRIAMNYACYLGLTAAGNIWSKPSTLSLPDEKISHQAIVNSTGCSKEVQVKALQNYLQQPKAAVLLEADSIYGAISPQEDELFSNLTLIREILPKAGGNHPVKEDLLLELHDRIIQMEVRRYLYQCVCSHFCDFIAKPCISQKELLKHICNMKRLRMRQWKQHRANIPNKHLPVYIDKLNSIVRDFKKELSVNNYVLSVRFFLPDVFCSPFVNINIESGSSRQIITQKAQYKPSMHVDSYYEILFPFFSAKKPSAVNIEIFGYGGQGIAHLHIMSKDRVYRPMGVSECHGVTNPTNVLRDNSQWCYLGNHDNRPGFVNDGYAKVRNSINVLLEDKRQGF